MSAIISLLNKIPFGSPAGNGFFLYSRISPGVLEKMAECNFRKTVSFVYEHSRFYRRRFNELGINPRKVRRPEDLGDFFTTAEDLRRYGEDFVCQRPDTAYETTGTTSKKPKRVYFSRGEIKEAGWIGAVGLWNLGVRKEDRIASAFDYSFWVSGPVLQASCEVLGCFHVEAGRMDPLEFYERTSDYRLTVIVGDPSWIVRLSEVAEKRDARSLKLILGGGENVTEEARRYVEGVWKTDFILGYGQTEAFGAIGMESRFKEGYHLNEFHNYFEIIKPDVDGYGELVYTTLNRRVMPLVRYRSGDVTRFLKGEPKGSLRGKRIEKLKGRVDEWVPTGMGNLAPWMFEPIFQGIDGVTGDWQIEIEKEGNKDKILFHLEAKDGEAGARSLKEEALARLRKELPDAWRALDMGLITVDWRVHSPGSLRLGRKLRRIVDNRKF